MRLLVRGDVAAQVCLQLRQRKDDPHDPDVGQGIEEIFDVRAVAELDKRLRVPECERTEAGAIAAGKDKRREREVGHRVAFKKQDG
jgi:hypothetical protein